MKAIVLAERLGVYELPDTDSEEKSAVFSGQELELSPMLMSHGLVFGYIAKPLDLEGFWVATGPADDQERWIKKVKQ